MPDAWPPPVVRPEGAIIDWATRPQTEGVYQAAEARTDSVPAVRRPFSLIDPELQVKSSADDGSYVTPTAPPPMASHRGSDAGLYSDTRVARSLAPVLLQTSQGIYSRGPEAETADAGQSCPTAPQQDERVLGPGQWPLPVKTPYLTSDRDAGQGDSSTPLHVQETVLGKTFEEDLAVRLGTMNARWVPSLEGRDHSPPNISLRSTAVMEQM